MVSLGAVESSLGLGEVAEKLLKDVVPEGAPQDSVLSPLEL